MSCGLLLLDLTVCLTSTYNRAHFVRLEGHRSIMGVLRKLLESVSKDADVLEDQGFEHSDMRDAPRRRSNSVDDEPLSPRNGSIGLCTDRLVKRLQTESLRGGRNQILLVRKFRTCGYACNEFLDQINFDLRMYCFNANAHLSLIYA